jgi:pyruvate dehydrogenase E2 component (dihydrolipoamide acetyltransferase)
VPVLHQADIRAVEELARRLQDLSQRAREGQLRPDEVEGGTFTITNLGMFGIESFDPILNPPQSAILGVGAAVPTPVAWEGTVAIRPRMQLTLAADHRVLDGAVAAQFLQDVKAGIEEPTLLLL